MRTKKTLTTKLVLTAVLILLTTATARATDFITEVMVIGNSDETQVNNLWYDLVGKGGNPGQGWTGVNYDLNHGAGGDYIYLLYKTASNTDGLNFGEFITDFYIKMGADNVNSTLTHDGRTYHLVPYDGSDHFKSQKGDLNSGTGENTPSIHLYYTTDIFPDNRAVTGISFNETSDGAVGEDGGSTACDLNKGCGENSAYIYMHITTATAMPFSGMGTADNPFLIGSADEWDRFAAYVGQGLFADMCYQLTANISTSTMVGSGEHPFSGTFDGNGKSLSVTINSDEQYAAPFHYINAATIKNLTVGGTITSSANYAAGLVGICSGSTNTISGCNVTANVAGSGYAGGIVGHGGTSTLIIDNCVYSGAISGFNQVAGGILGWCNGMTLTMRNNCLFVGTFSPAYGGAYHPIACCYDSDHTVNATFTSTYYMNTLTPTAYCFNESNFNKVSTTYVNNVWNIAVTAVNGITYYAKTPGVALPYSYGFEASLNAEGWTLVNGVTSTAIATSDTDFPAHEGSHYLYVSNDGQTTQYLIAPEFKGDTPMTMTFWQKRVLDEPRFQVGYSTKPKPDVTVDGDFVWDNEQTASANWTKEERTFPAGTKFVAIRFLPGTIQFCYFDDFSFTVCDYPAPVNLVVSTLTDNTATLSWEAPNTAASISTYTCEYKKDGDADWTALATQTGNTYTLSGLTGLTAYNFRVKANYDVGGESIYQPISFTTLMSLPYECGFENGMLGWGQVDINWGYTGITTDIAHDGTHSYVFELHIPDNKKDQYLISPPMCTTSSKTVSFYFRTSIAASETFFVGFSTDNINFVAVKQITTDETQWQFYTCTIPEYARCLIIKYTSNKNNLYFDDFSIMEYSDKARPTGLAVSSLTTQSATVSWTAPTGATGYAYQYRKVGDDAWSAEAQVTATTVTLTSLSVNTFYNFRVKALYGSDASNFEPIGFQTEDNAVSLPYEAPFGDGDMGGWRMVDCDGNTGIASYCFRFAQSFQHSQYLISPELECSMDMFMNFSYTSGSDNEAETSTFRVGYSTTTKDLSAFTWGGTITAGIDEKTFTAVFPQETKYVAIEKLAGGHLLFTGQIDFEGRHVSVTLTKEGYGTYFRNYSDFVLPAGVKAHIVTGMNDDNTLNYETVADGSTSNNTVPAMTAVLLQTTPSSGQQTIVVTLDCPTKEPITETNLMHAWNRYSPTSGDGYHYKLNYDANGENLGWYWGAENGEAFEIAPYRAWLVLPRTAPAFISLSGDVTTYTITYDLAGGALAAGVTNPTTYTPESAAITLSNPTREGYTFTGWTGTGLDAATMSVTIAQGSTGDRSYTATWTKNTCALVEGTAVGVDALAGLVSTWQGKQVEVSLTRSFTADVASTICLPFAMTSIEGGKVYELRDVAYDNSVGVKAWVATMNDVTPDQNLVTSTEAGKPYLFMPSATGEVTFTGTIASVPASFTPVEATGTDGWKMKGTYTKFAWESATHGTIFGFASGSKEVNGKAVQAGEFVKAVSGAKVPAFRAYLTYTGDNTALQARGVTRGETEELPSRIIVRLVGADGSTTAIGTMDTRSGEVSLEGWYDLNGHRLDSMPTRKGIYIHNGKKVRR